VAKIPSCTTYKSKQSDKILTPDPAEIPLNLWELDPGSSLNSKIHQTKIGILKKQFL